MEREHGFYWISEAGADPEVGLWQDGAWWLSGSEEAAPAIEVLSPRLRLAPPLLAAA